jgi:ribosome-associated protein
MDGPIILARGVEIPIEEIAIEYSRSSGPGGQHVNKTETRVTLRFALTETRAIPEPDKARMLERLSSRITKSCELLVSCDSHRDRPQNVRTAFERLTELLARAYHRPRARKPTRPSRGAKERRLDEKRRLKSKKRDRKTSDDR